MMEHTSTSMARPFAVDPQLLDLPNPFPNPEELYKALSGGTRNGREIFARLWLTEGVPAIFRHCPAIYEELRGWLGRQLNVHPKEINLIGSARIGYSLAPLPDFGRPFGAHSDLDLSVISASLFDRLVGSVQLFREDFKEGSIQPKSHRERALWDANLQFAERNIPRGFFDSNKIPNLHRYPAAQQINQAMWALSKKLEATPGVPNPKRVSTRVYRDWHCFIDRVSFNLLKALPTA